MAHVFVAPHPDDVALSCGGLVARLRERGEDVAVLTLFSGTGGARRLTPYQREALGFGTGSALRDADAAAEAMARRRLEDERFAAFAGVSTALLDLPDAVFRGYEGDDQLLGAPRADDPAPVAALRGELARLARDGIGIERLYCPMGIGRHVDHQLARDAGLALLADGPDGSLPFASWAGRVALYEDFPYAHWSGFSGLADLPAGALGALPGGVALRPELTDVAGVLERKVEGIAQYASQMDRLFGGAGPMAEAVRAYAARVAGIAGMPGGAAERYWVAAGG